MLSCEGRSQMAKTPRYPKKFRQKLEKVKAGVEGRSRLKDGDASDFNPFGTMWHRFFPKNSVSVMSTRVDEKTNTMETHYQLMVEKRFIHTAPAPWIL